ncbi:MAG: ribonuclease HII [Ruminococcaceae bacterium]|nr:ribonuclease HII [Oscillospiraceae bacterium]
MNWLAYEEEALAEGFEVVCGIDEAGRGPLAGPVCAACVVLPKGMVLEGVNDSKKLSEKKRDALYDVIKQQALDYGIAFASEKEIDEINILQATFLAMRRAVEKLQKVQPDIALIDGNKTPGLSIAERCIIKGDGKSANIAAASILAKVTRDRYMLELAQQYPQYQFEKHKGYGTKLHYEMIEKYGVSDIHRRSFLKKILEK